MFPDIKEIRRARKKYNYTMITSGVSSFKDLQELEANALKSGEIPQKFKELIALGISIGRSCYG
jgi:hypothetical protein